MKDSAFKANHFEISGLSTFEIDFSNYIFQQKFCVKLLEFNTVELKILIISKFPF